MLRFRLSHALIIVCGLPGSGKTTLSKTLEARLQAVRLSADDWLDALSVNLYDEDMRATVELYYLTAPLDVLFERLQLRGRESPPIQLAELSRWSGRIEVPTPAEAELFDKFTSVVPEPNRDGYGADRRACNNSSSAS